MKNLILTIVTLLIGYSVLAQEFNQADKIYWNGFVDFVATKGYKGSPELDRRDKNLSQELFKQYNKINNQTVDYVVFVTRFQIALSSYRNEAIKEIKSGKTFLEGYKLGDTTYNFDTNFMVGLSKIDGWAGSKTTSWKFPKRIMNVVHNSPVAVTDLSKLKY